MTRTAEATAVGIVGAALGYGTGLVLQNIGVEGAAPVLGAVGGLNGLVSGGAQIYAWTTMRGRLAFVLDSSWAMVGTFTGMVLHAANVLVPGRDYVRELSRRQNRHVYAKGAALRGGFALSMGNVISNAAGTVGLRGESEAVARRRRFVTAHEELHIWQNRAFGPAFQALYLLWMAIGGVAGFLAWPFVGGGLGRSVETVAYYNNPFEYWAYRNDDYWPPRDIHPKLGWKGRRPV